MLKWPLYAVRRKWRKTSYRKLESFRTTCNFYYLHILSGLNEYNVWIPLDKNWVLLGDNAIYKSSNQKCVSVWKLIKAADIADKDKKTCSPLYSFIFCLNCWVHLCYSVTVLEKTDILMYTLQPLSCIHISLRIKLCKSYEKWFKMNSRYSFVVCS